MVLFSYEKSTSYIKKRQSREKSPTHISCPHHERSLDFGPTGGPEIRRQHETVFRHRSAACLAGQPTAYCLAPGARQSVRSSGDVAAPAASQKGTVFSAGNSEQLKRGGNATCRPG